MMEQIGRYRIIGELGRGAMGVVYHATDPAIGRSVAIKTIRILDINDTERRDKLRERLFREARSAGVLSHPNIVTIYDMDETEGLAYIAMAYVNGPTLEKILESDAPLSGANMLRILRQTALGLDYAHGRGIIHRDIKPANIMITTDEQQVLLTDFGSPSGRRSRQGLPARAVTTGRQCQKKRRACGHASGTCRSSISATTATPLSSRGLITCCPPMARCCCTRSFS